MQNDVEAVKTRTDIVQVVGESVQLRKAGQNFKGLCPFHSEKTPSFMVSPGRQSYHCFGCGEGGDVFSFVMKREAVDFAEALQMMAKRAGVQLTQRKGGDSKVKQRLFEVLELATKYFQAAYEHSSGAAARDYVASRGMSAESLTRFRIGYAPDDYEAMISALRKKDITDKEMLESGLAITGKRGIYSRFRGRLMIPIADVTGNIRGFTGRVLDPDAKEAKYVNTPETLLYHKGKIIFALDLAKQAIVEADAAVVVEGQMDVIAAHGAGTENVVAVSGTALTEDQLRLLTRFSNNLIFALDTDDAGHKALLRCVELVGDRDIEIKVVELGDAKDPDELIKRDLEAWKKAIAEAVPVIDYLITHALGGRTRPFDRKVIADVLGTVLPVLKYRSPIDRDYYTEQLAMTLGVEKQSIQHRLGMTEATVTTEETEQTNVAPETTPAELVSQRMLGLVMISPEISKQLAAIDLRLFPESYQRAAETLRALPENAQNAYTVKTASPEERSILDVCNLAAAEYESLSPQERSAEFDRLLTRLKSLWIRQHQPKLLAAIKRAEEHGDTDRRNRLMEEYTSLTKRITHG